MAGKVKVTWYLYGNVLALSLMGFQCAFFASTLHTLPLTEMPIDPTVFTIFVGIAGLTGAVIAGFLANRIHNFVASSNEPKDVVHRDHGNHNLCHNPSIL
jgi:hypothetical protein